MDIDLTGSSEFCLAADGGDGFDNSLDDDTFAWSFRYTGTDGSQPAGFLLAGNPRATDPNYVLGGSPPDGTNTYFGIPSLCSATSATGLLTQDLWYLEDPVTPGNSGCFFFSPGYINGACTGPFEPYASWFMEIQAATGTCSADLSTTYCLSNPNFTGVNSTMTVTGSRSISANDVTLTATVPANLFGFFLTSRTQGFTAMPPNSVGNICLGGAVGRFQNLATNSGPTGTISISTGAGQWSLTSIPESSTGGYAAIAGESANFQLWHRACGALGCSSNFTDGVSVTWEP